MPDGDKDVLTPLRCLVGLRVKQVAAGGMHSLALTENGQVRAGPRGGVGWGGRWGGGLHAFPLWCPLWCVSSAVGGPYTCLAAVVSCCCRQPADAVAAPTATQWQIWRWGEPWGDFSMTIDRTPRRIDTTGDFVGIACGAFHNLALNSAG